MKVIFMTGNHTSRMRNWVPCAVILATLISSASPPAATYNPLWIPPMISGTTFNLSLNQTNRAFKPTGAKTVTYAFNSGDFWGPTLVMNKGDVVQMRVTNNLANTTTVHWHGFHIPAIMDGGPHQMIAPGTVWTPSFIIKNDAATYWYHPHLHGTSQEQLTKGAGGFIIVRDAQEAALPLPRTYGVDDLPVVFTSRRFLTNAYQGVTPGNQFAYDHLLDNYGDYLLANGVTNAQISLPAQFVRLRLLNAEIERGYNLGFSDNRIFHVIANDQGLLNAPVPVTRMFLMVGERVEILLNLSTNTVGSSLDLKAYNSGQVFGFPGQEGNPLPPNGSSGPINSSLLNNTDFNLLHIVVTAATTNAITSLPATLATNIYWTSNDVSNTRTITLTGGQGGSEFTFNNATFNHTNYDHTINLNAVEKWIVSNQAGAIFGHSFHIHDVRFKIVARNGGTQVTSTGLPAAYESGWKDTFYVPKGETATFIAKFDDFASNVNPFMYHCHFINHEDGGMMGQFRVVNNAVENIVVANVTRTGTNNHIALRFNATPGTTYTLQYAPNLETITWGEIASVTSDGSAVNFTETNATRLASSRGFYRVIMPVIPDAAGSGAAAVMLKAAGLLAEPFCGPKPK